jgi:predicted RND superfamily exporter protein
VWEKEAQEEFVQQLRQVDPDVTGNPVIGYESIKAMKEGYIEGGVYAFLAILVVTFLTLRRVGDTLLAILPLGLGVVWTAGLMWIFNLQFNLANLVAVPLIIGIGVENGIHLVHRYREEGIGGPALVAGSTGQAVALFSLTTMIGFGSLMVARYYGIFSMGLLLTIAVGSVLVASLTVLPLLLFRSPPQNPSLPLPKEIVVDSPSTEEAEWKRVAGRG